VIESANISLLANYGESTKSEILAKQGWPKKDGGAIDCGGSTNIYGTVGNGKLANFGQNSPRNRALRLFNKLSVHFDFVLQMSQILELCCYFGVDF
jgi:hypothetical protein